MQPDRNPNNNDWQQPKEQPSQVPYTPQEEEHDKDNAKQPVVTLTPNESEDFYVQDTPQPVSVTDGSQAAQAEPVRWQATEYIHHEKGPLWFVLFAVVVIGLIALAIFIIQSVTFAILIPVMAAALLVYVNRPPRVLNYALSPKGLYINDHLHPFGEFKGFGVIHDGKEYSVVLLPIKRFQPVVSVYFPEEAGEAIVDALGTRLPMQELHLDFVDRIIRKLRI